MPEGDTIHRAARRIESALVGKLIERAEAPNQRSPLYRRVGRLEGQTLERVEARGKHLLAYFSGGDVIHSHLGMNGRWWIGHENAVRESAAWLLLVADGRAIVQRGGKILRLASGARIRSDPILRRLGPDPLGTGFDPAEATARLRSLGGGRQIGEALLDQRILAGSGNAIRVGALFNCRLDPWRSVAEIADEDLRRVVDETTRIMNISVAEGRRPASIYRAERAGCPACGGRVNVRGQGDDNRTTYWCGECQS